MKQVENGNGKVVQEGMKFCQHCGEKILQAAVVCPHCGCQVAEMKQKEQVQPSIVINNSNSNHNVNKNTNVVGGVGRPHPKNKWVSFVLCLFLGCVGVHKFYEGRTGMGLLYLFTMGLFGIGWIVDCIALLFKPNPYYV